MSLSRQDSRHQQYRVELEELEETQTTSSHHNYEHQDGKPQQSCHQPSSMESDWSDDLDAALEEQLKLIRQFKLPGEEEDTVHQGMLFSASQSCVVLAQIEFMRAICGSRRILLCFGNYFFGDNSPILYEILQIVFYKLVYHYSRCIILYC